MNRLSTERRAQIVKALVEGNSLRSTSRITGVAINTVVKLLTDLGAAALEYQDIAMRDLSCERLQADEIWSFIYAKAKNVPARRKGEFGVGDIWTWTALCADTKLIPSWMVGTRDAGTAKIFLEDLAGRLRHRVQLTTHGHGAYLAAVEHAFGVDIDYAMLVKLYGADPEHEKRYSPAKCVGTDARIIRGTPDPKHVSTSYVERSNLTMRMGMRRFTRLTNGFSKKLENHMHAIALHFLHYNFARPHKTLSKPYPTTPAMANDLSDHVWSFEEIVEILPN